MRTRMDVLRSSGMSFDLGTVLRYVVTCIHHTLFLERRQMPKFLIAFRCSVAANLVLLCLVLPAKSLQAFQQSADQAMPLLPDVIPCSCDLEGVHRDWGTSFEVAFKQYEQRGDDFKTAAYRAIGSYSRTDISSTPRVTEAKRSFKRQPSTPWPPIYLIEDMRGFYTGIFYKPDDAAVAFIMISKPLYAAIDDTMLAALLAHEISHPETGSASIGNHMLVDKRATDLIDARDLERLLRFIIEAKARYEYSIRATCKKAIALPDYIIWGEDLRPRLDSLSAHPH